MKRYKFVKGVECDGADCNAEMEKHPMGDYVLWSEVEDMRKDWASAIDAMLDVLRKASRTKENQDA